MNVNPFSYLIEKLKGKVDKSGDTMTGRLNIERSGESYVRAVNTDKQVGAYLDADTNAEHGVWSNGYNNGSFQSLGRWLLKRGTSGDVYVNDTKVPYNGGTLALTSDLVAQDFNTTKSIGANSNDFFTINNFTKTGYTLGSIVCETSHTGIYVAYNGLSGTTGYFSIFNPTNVARTDEPIRLHVLWVKS